MSIIEPSFVDLYKKIKRAPQIISLKEIGYIIAETGINSKCRILDSGTGSGALACYLAHIVEEVISYEIRADFMLVAEENKKSLNLKNLRLFNKNIYDGIAEKNLDVIILDLPEPWKAVKSAKNALKVALHSACSPHEPKRLPSPERRQSHQDTHRLYGVHSGQAAAKRETRNPAHRCAGVQGFRFIRHGAC